MHRLLAFLLALPLLAQIVPIDPNSPVASGPAIINSNFTFLASSKVAIWSGSGAPGSIPLSVLGDLYVNTSGAPPVAYQCMRATACNAVGSGNWQLVGNVVTGGTCTNQVVSAISTSAVPTCVTITSAYVNSSIALTGVDINTSSQVTVTHLASPLPVLQGGTGTTTPALVQGTNITITGSWPNQTINASGTGGTGNAGATVSIANSATPTFTCPSSTAGTTVFFHLASALATNITGSTLSGCTGSSTLSSILNFTFTQASSGGPYTIVMPAGFSQACQVSPIASADTNMSFYWDGTTAHLISCSASAGPSVGLEQAAPSITPSSGYELGWLDSTGNFPRYKNSAGTIFQAAKELSSGNIRKAGGANTADSAAAAADLVALFSGCSGTLYLGADGDCHSSGAGTTLSNGYYSTPFPITGQEISLTLSSSANVVTCWSRAWPVNQTLSSVQGNEFGSVATSNHYAFAIYSGGNLVQQSGTVTAHNSSNSPFTATFSVPPTMTNSEAVDFCTTADGSGSVIIGMIDASGTSTFIQLINQGSQKLVFTAANASTGTTTLTFPSTLGAKTAVTLAWPTVAAFQ